MVAIPKVGEVKAKERIIKGMRKVWPNAKEPLTG